MERCLACEAVVSRETALPSAFCRAVLYRPAVTERSEIERPPYLQIQTVVQSVRYKA